METTYKNLNFGAAFDFIKRYPNSYCMRLPKWSEDVVIKVQMPDKESKMTAPYLYVESRFGKVPWKETMIEMFADDWEVHKFEEPSKVQIKKANKSEIENTDEKCNSNCKKKCQNECNHSKLAFKEKDANSMSKEDYEKALSVLLDVLNLI